MEKESTFEIYKITNCVNNKIYVGATMDGTGVRWRRHIIKANAGGSTPICKAIREFGKDNFKIEVIELCDNEGHMNIREAYWIAQLGATNSEIGYNSKIGGGIRHQSEETKEKISKLHKGKESKFRKPILQYDKDGNLVREYPSVSEAVETTKISKSSIIRVLNKIALRFTNKNPYVWIYKNESEEVKLRINPAEYYIDLDYKVKPSENFLAKARECREKGIGQGVFNKPVEQYDLNGVLLNTYRSLAEASKATGISQPTIRKYASDENYINSIPENRRKYLWKFGELTENTKINTAEIIKKAAEKNTKIIELRDSINGNILREVYGIKALAIEWHADIRTIKRRIDEQQPIRGYYLNYKTEQSNI